jgi:hypothetical protein
MLALTGLLRDPRTHAIDGAGEFLVSPSDSQASAPGIHVVPQPRNHTRPYRLEPRDFGNFENDNSARFATQLIDTGFKRWDRRRTQIAVQGQDADIAEYLELHAQRRGCLE